MLLRLPFAFFATLPLVAPTQLPLRVEPSSPSPASSTLLDKLYADPDYSKLVRLLQRTRLIPGLNNLTESTLFAPNNEAIDRYTNRKPSSAWARLLTASDDAAFDDNVHEELRQHLFYHVLSKTEDISLSSSVKAHDTLYYPRKPTEPPSHEPPPSPPWLPLPGGSLGGLPQRLRVTPREDKAWAGVDSTGAGGVELVSKEGVTASNGILYGLEDVIEQPANIYQIISDHSELSYLAKIMPKDVADALRNGEALTLFLPVDSKWEALDPIERLYLESEFSTQDVTNVIGMHSLNAKGVKWTDKLKSGSNSYPTVYGNEIEINVTDDQVTVGSGKVVHADIYAANGVIHLIDSLLIPSGALQLTPEKYLLALNCTKFVGLLHSVNLRSMINSTDSPMTILAPQDDVLGIFDGPDDLPLPGSDELKDMLQYHFIPGRWTPDQLVDSSLLETALFPSGLAGAAQVVEVSVEKKGGKGKKVDIGFGGAAVLGDPVKLPGMDVIVYMVTRPLTPPDDALKVAAQQLHMAIFLAAVSSASLEKQMRTHPRTTFVVPDNTAFEQLGLITTYLLLPSSKSDLENVIAHHSLDGVYYPDEILHGSALTYKTLEGSDVHVTRGPNGTLHIGASGGWAGMQGSFTTSNLLTMTGAIHEVSETVLLPRSVPITVAKLAKAAKASTMAGLVVRAGFEWVLDGSPPPANSPYAAPDMQGAAWVLLAPTDDAFKNVNLTALHADETALHNLVAQHVVPARVKSPPPASGAPLYMGDATAYTTGLSPDSSYGDVVFREIEAVADPRAGAPAQVRFVVGIRGARGTKALGDWARVLAWGRSTVGATAAGGGVVQIDTVLMPYRPPWYIAWGQPTALLIVGVTSIAAFWWTVWKVWSRDTTEATYEPLGGYTRDDEDD